MMKPVEIDAVPSLADHETAVSQDIHSSHWRAVELFHSAIASEKDNVRKGTLPEAVDSVEARRENILMSELYGREKPMLKNDEARNVPASRAAAHEKEFR